MARRVPTLLHAMNHHAKDKEALINALALVYATMLAPYGWAILSVRGGANSWCIVSPDKGRQFHFRNGGKGCILVWDHWYGRDLGRTPVKLTSRVDVIRWAGSL